MTARVDIDQSALTSFLESENGPVERELDRRARRVERAARRFVPVDSGELWNSLHHDVTRDEQGLAAEIGSDLPYALRVEMGFRGIDSLGREYNQGPQPYLRPALREANGERATLSSDEAHFRAAFNDSRRRRAGGRTLSQDRRQLRRNTGNR